MTSMAQDLPTRWKRHRLDELVESVRETAKLDAAALYSLWSVPSFAAGQPEVVTGESIGSGKLLLEVGDVLLCKINPRINRVWLVDQRNENLRQIGSTEWLVARTRDRSQVDERYLRLFLTAPEFREWIVGATSGVTGSHTRAKTESILKQAVPVPPEAEQRAIVKILEDHLSRLDAAVAGVTAVRAKTEVLRRALLRDAFTGALTGRNETGAEAPDGWVVRSLDEINDPTRPICYGILMPGPDVPDGIPYVKVRNIRGGRVLLDGVHRTTPEIESKYSRSRLRAGDLLVSIRGTYGRTATVPVELDGGNITQDTARVAPVGVDPSYVLRFLDSPQAQSYFKTVARGVAVKGVNIGDLRKLPVPVPQAEEQRAICDALDEQLPRIDAVLAAATVAETRARAARRSLLYAAFRGDLTEEWRERHG